MTDTSEVLHGLTLLIVEDDEVDRRSIRRALLAGGVQAEVLEAPEATRGLELLRTKKIDCALMDFNMPGRDGLWLVQQARAHGVRTPLIVLTGQGDEHTACDQLIQRAAGQSPAAWRGILDGGAGTTVTQTTGPATVRHQQPLTAAAAGEDPSQ